MLQIGFSLLHKYKALTGSAFLLVLSALIGLSAYSENTQAKKVERVSVTDAAENWTPQDDEAEIFFGRNMAAQMLGQYPLLEDEQVQGYINHLGSVLVRYSDRPDLDFYFGVLDSEKMNAYAAPGGYIFITKGALMLSKNESELAGILAHEIAHVTHRHIVKQLNIRGKKADDFSGMMSAIIAGGTQSATSAFRVAIDEALDSWYGAGLKSREDEFEADKVATQILTRVGYPVDGFAQFLNRMSTLKKETSDRVRTHPPFKERVARITDKIDEFRANSPIGKSRFEANLASLITYKHDKDRVLKELSQAPLLPDESLQKYLNQLYQVASQTLALPDKTLSVVEADEAKFINLTHYLLVSAGTLNLFETESQLVALLLYSAYQPMLDSPEALDYRIAVGLESLGHRAESWLQVQSILSQYAEFKGFRTNNKRLTTLKKSFDFATTQPVGKDNWHQTLQQMNQVRADQDIHPLLSWLPAETDQEITAYLNLMAFALNQQLNQKLSRDLIALERVMVVNDDYLYARMQGTTMILSRGAELLAHSEDQLAGLMLYGMLRSQESKSKASSRWKQRKNDNRVTQFLEDFGYDKFAWFQYLTENADRPYAIESEHFQWRAFELSESMGWRYSELERFQKNMIELVQTGAPNDFFKVEHPLKAKAGRKLVSQLKVDPKSWVEKIEFTGANQIPTIEVSVSSPP